MVHRVTETISQKKEHFKRFPTNPAERRDVMEGFYDIYQIPGVIGAIDGSHIPIIVNPGGANAHRFMNRNGYYSFNCQLVCKHLLFTNVVCRWCGSAHDSRIFQESNLCAQLGRGEVSEFC